MVYQEHLLYDQVLVKTFKINAVEEEVHIMLCTLNNVQKKNEKKTRFIAVGMLK